MAKKGNWMPTAIPPTDPRLKRINEEYKLLQQRAPSSPGQVEQFEFRAMKKNINTERKKATKRAKARGTTYSDILTAEAAINAEKAIEKAEEEAMRAAEKAEKEAIEAVERKVEKTHRRTRKRDLLRNRKFRELGRRLIGRGRNKKTKQTRRRRRNTRNSTTK